MTDKEAIKKVIEGTIRILEASGHDVDFYPKFSMEDNTNIYDLHAQYIVHLLNKHKEQDILDELDRILIHYKDRHNVEFITKEYIHCIQHILRIRIDLAKTSAAMPPISYDIQHNKTADQNIFMPLTPEDIIAATNLKNLETMADKTNDIHNTIINYHLIEVYGKDRIIHDAMAIVKHPVTIDIISSDKTSEWFNIRYKEHWHDRPIWNIIEIPPTVILKFVE